MTLENFADHLVRGVMRVGEHSEARPPNVLAGRATECSGKFLESIQIRVGAAATGVRGQADEMNCRTARLWI